MRNYAYMQRHCKNQIMWAVFSVGIFSITVIPLFNLNTPVHGTQFLPRGNGDQSGGNQLKSPAGGTASSGECDSLEGDSILMSQVPEENGPIEEEPENDDEDDPGENGQSDDAGEDEDDWDDEEETSLHRIKGFVELENFINTYTDQEFSDTFKKNELRNNIEYRFGTGSLHLLVNTNLYLIPYIFSNSINSEYIYSDDFQVSRNLRISSPAVELNFNEFYVNYEVDRYRFRIGNQLYSWGTTDVINPTSYFNPYDLREFLIRDQEELKVGIPSISSLITLGDYSLEVVIVPVHVPMILPDSGNFWAFRYKEGPFPVTVGEPQAMDPGILETGLGLQFYMNLFETDIYLSAYHGPDKEPLLRPMGTLIVPNEPVNLFVSPQYYTLDIFGIAASRAVDRFIIQGEFAYSPDRTGVVDQAYGSSLTLPFDVRKSHWISYSVGCNYLIPLSSWFDWHDGDSVITFEWSQSIYTDPDMMTPLFTDIFVMQFRDTFLDNRLKGSITGIFDINNESFIIMPQAEYKFRSGISVSLSYVFIKSEADSFLGFYNNNDIVMVRVRYEYL